MKTAEQHISIVRGTAQKLQDVEKRILEQTGLTAEELFDLKLNIGLKFVQQFCKIYISNREYIYNNLVYNADWCFWNWWQLKWGQDDALILQTAEPFSNNYEIKKECMVGCDTLTKDLYWMITKYTDEV